MSVQTNNYIVIPKPCSGPKMRLVCFPHSGGGPSVFNAWPDPLMEHRIEVVVVSAPGRERRVEEAPITDWEVLVSEICEALQQSGIVDDVPYAFFGHSLGALVAYECARFLEARLMKGRPRPVHLIASAHSFPTTPEQAGKEFSPMIHALPDSELVKEISKLGLLTTAILEDDKMLKVVMPALRADLQLNDTFKPAAKRTPLELPITVFGGEADELVSVAALKTWAAETSVAGTDVRVFPGGHFFFLDESKDTVLQAMLGDLDKTYAGLKRALDGHPSTLPPADTLIHQVFEEYARTTPDNEALVMGKEVISFKELMRRADILAMAVEARLKTKDSRIVALLMAKNPTFAVCMVGLFKAAATLLYVELHFPDVFVKETCEECTVKLGITTANYRPRFKEVDCEIMQLDDGWLAALEANHVPMELPKPKPEDICCLTWTSGTTGRPKTIACTQHVFRVGSLERIAMRPEPDDRMAVNVMFVWEVLFPLAYGIPTYLMPDDAVLDPQLLVTTMGQCKITRTLTTPSLLATILQHCASGLRQRLPQMRLWMACGEVCPMTTVQRFQELLPEATLVNDYSTWESGDVSYAVIKPGEDYYFPSKVFAPVGPLALGKVVAIIDPDTKQLVPMGVPGDVYVGGEGISDGYFRKPETTAEKFIPGWLPEMKERWSGVWYKTGDMGRLVGDPAQLEIRGRSDSTIKIRGFKVGIPTVEAAIQEVEGVGMCAVIPVYSAPGIADALVCFIGPQEGFEYNAVEKTVRTQGPKKLPRFMLPSYYRPFPESAFSDGEARKLNRKKLAEGLTLESLKVADEPEATVEAVPLEQGVRGILRTVWAKALNLNASTLDLEENFFDLGGHSNLAAAIAAELSGEYGIAITVLDIYSHSTLGELFEHLDPSSGDEVSAQKGAPPRRPLVTGTESVAVYGVAGRFPGADDTDAFWQNLRTGAVSATFISPEVLRSKGVPEDVIKNKEFVPCAYMINDADKFDNQFFGIVRHEATIMDPQHRVFIEVAWASVENAGLAPRGGLANSVVGVFAAAGIDGYLVHHLEGEPLKDTMNPQDIFLAEIGSEKDYIATRTAYLLDFTGPAMNVNSACSSALVAAAQGASCISTGQCDAAVAGASAIGIPNLGYRYQDGLVNSVDGLVRPFDKEASGTVFGDSVGAVLLRRVEKDIRGLAWGVLRGFSVTNDGGQKAGYAAPSPVGQSQAMMNAMQMAEIDPWSMSYVECHCTGTRVGDGIEVRGMLDSFVRVGGKPKEDQANIALGSVKGNIAHANCAAGVTGMAKVLLMLRSRELAPTANFKTLSPKIDLRELPFFVAGETSKWQAGETPLRAGVSAFGIGGTNAHVILEEPPVADQEPASQAVKKTCWNYQLLPISAKSPGALWRNMQSVAAGLKREADQAPTAAAGAAFALQVGRVAMPLRKAVVVATPNSSSGTADGQAEDLRAVATALESNVKSEEELEDLPEAGKKPSVAFVFPGQGSQYLGMARDLYQQIPLFRECVEQCCEKLKEKDFLGSDLRPVLFGGTPASEEEFSKPTVLQPSLFIVEYALSQLLLAVGVTPVVAAGHSLGEYTAAVLSGLISLEGALAIVAARAKATETLAEEGAMLSVANWTDAELEEVSSGSKPGLWLAAVNSPVHAVISGEKEAIAALQQKLEAESRKCTRLHVTKAFHSQLVAKAAETLTGLGTGGDGAAQGTTRTVSVPVASNFTGGWLNAQQLQDGSYWQQHMRGTVRWRDNTMKILNTWKPAFVLEVGPGNALSMLGGKCIQSGEEAPAFPQTMRHPKDTSTHDVAAFLSAIGTLWEGGCSINWQALHTDVLGEQRVPALLRLPTYSFEKTSLWKNSKRSIYVEAESGAATEEVATSSAAAKAGTLVRFADRSAAPIIKAYCLPYAGGSSVLFAPWAEAQDALVEVIALELPGRGGRADEAPGATDADDNAMLDQLCDMIINDVGGSEYALVGLSMGGNLIFELALRMQARKVQLPLGLYIAGRRPPADDPDSIVMPEFSDEQIMKYLVAPAEVTSSPAFLEHMLPLLRADLQADTRAEKRLSQTLQNGSKLAPGIALELFCGTNDDVAPWKEASRWQRAAQVPASVHYFPGGHEFMMECRMELFTQWRRDAVGRLTQKRSAELAILTAHGFASPGMQLPTAAFPQLAGLGGAAMTKQDEGLPLYAVRWVSAIAEGPRQEQMTIPYCFDLGADASEDAFQRAVAAMKNGAGVMAVCRAASKGALMEQEYEVKQCWRFVSLVHRLLEAETSGRVVVVCPAAGTGAMVAGASKAVAMEASEFQIQRLFVPASLLTSLDQVTAQVNTYAELASRFPDETDVWAQTEALLQGAVHVQRLERASEPSDRLPCVQRRTTSGDLATFVLTGATGGLGQAVVEWLLNDQKLLPEQLVLLRRAGSTELKGVLAKCRSIEVKNLSSLEELCGSSLKELKDVSGIFHLAGVLDDGVLASMTEERFSKVAQPKTGIAAALLRASTSLGWKLQWFLGFSSTSSLFGYAGQTNYCAANALLDNLATFAGTDGLPEGDRAPCRVIAINWGPWGEIGMAKKGTKAYQQAVREGDTPLSTAAALRCLAAALRSSTTAQPAAVQFCACDVAWERSQWQSLPILKLVHQEASETADASSAAMLQKAGGGLAAGAPAPKSKDDPAVALEKFLIMSTDSRKKWSQIENKNFVQLGLDSLETVQVRNAFNKEFKVNVPLTVFAQPTQKVGDLRTALMQHISPTRA